MDVAGLVTLEPFAVVSLLDHMRFLMFVTGQEHLSEGVPCLDKKIARTHISYKKGRCFYVFYVVFVLFAEI